VTQQDNGGPAFPVHGGHHPDDDPRNHTLGGGMTLRQYAAIKLRVPDSGAEWLDAMILEAKRDDIAGQALGGLILGYTHVYGSPTSAADDIVKESYRYADAMTAARKGGAA
jgi:hypothetical protein